MTNQQKEPKLLFDRYRKPCSEAERNSLRDYQNVDLFIEVFKNAVESVDLDFEDFAPQVLIDTETGEIGFGFNQISIFNVHNRGR